MELKIEETRLENQLVLKVEGRLNAITTEGLQKMLMKRLKRLTMILFWIVKS